MIKNLLIASICLSSSFLFAQGGDIKIVKDNRIDALVKKQSEIKPPEVNPVINGFRVQLYFDSERQNINDARSRFIAQFPKIDTYVKYNAPNYFLKVGDFRTRLEAEKIKSEVEVEFPTSFIIEEDIHLPRLEKNPINDN
jgi:hypothetical protein